MTVKSSAPSADKKVIGDGHPQRDRFKPEALKKTPTPRIMIAIYPDDTTLLSTDPVWRRLGLITQSLIKPPAPSDSQAMVHVFELDCPKKRGRAVCAAAELAKRHKMTHLITLDENFAPHADDWKTLVKETTRYPDELILGKRALGRGRATLLRRGYRRFAAFWFRVQTASPIHDPLSGLRSYPLYLFRHLKVGQKGAGFDTEILVKTAWAGVTIREINLLRDARIRQKPHNITARLGAHLCLAALNLKLCMRSILPFPHLKLVDADSPRKEKISVLHPLKSLNRLLRENCSPIQLALAGALGVFLGTLPLVACHTIAILFAATYLRINKIAALSASQLCMPPIVPALCIEAGYYMRHGTFLTEVSMQTLGYEALERFLEWLMGSLVIAPLLAVATGAIIYLMAIIIKRWLPLPHDSI